MRLYAPKSTRDVLFVYEQDRCDAIALYSTACFPLPLSLSRYPFSVSSSLALFLSSFLYYTPFPLPFSPYGPSLPHPLHAHVHVRMHGCVPACLRVKRAGEGRGRPGECDAPSLRGSTTFRRKSAETWRLCLARPRHAQHCA